MPPSTKESAIAGPALVAAAWPVSTKMPAPMMQPIPREIRLHAESVRFKGTPPWVTKAWTSVSSASALSTAIEFLAKIFDTFPFPSTRAFYAEQASAGWLLNIHFARVHRAADGPHGYLCGALRNLFGLTLGQESV